MKEIKAIIKKHAVNRHCCCKTVHSSR